MIDRTIEETLLLSGVQIDRHNAVCTGGVEQIENQTGGDGLTTAVLLILARVAEEGRHHGNRLGGGALQSIDHDELFHDPLVDIARMTLQHEHVRTAHRFGETHVHLAIGKVIGRGFEDFGSQAFGHLLS